MDKYLPNNLKYLRKKNAVTQTAFGLQLNKTQKTIGNWETGFSEPSYLEIIQISNYFGITTDELLKEDMSNLRFEGNDDSKKAGVKPKILPKITPKILDDEGQKEASDAPVVNLFPKVVIAESDNLPNMFLINQKARAGYLNGYGDPEYFHTLPAYRLPGYNGGNFRMFEVAGLSMHPTLNDGDILITRSVESLTAIRNDHIHVVVTNDDGIVVKRVLNRIERDNKLILKSDNIKDRHEYPNMVVEPSQILEIWYVIGFISRIMKSPTEMYDRLIDLEGRLTIMEHNAKKAGL